MCNFHCLLTLFDNVLHKYKQHTMYAISLIITAEAKFTVMSAQKIVIHNNSIQFWFIVNKNILNKKSGDSYNSVYKL